MAQGIMQQGAEKYMGYWTSHMYSGDPNSAIGGTRLKSWQTEAADLNSRWCATWYGGGGLCEGMTWANKIHTGIANANLSAYIYWQGIMLNSSLISKLFIDPKLTLILPQRR